MYKWLMLLLIFCMGCNETPRYLCVKYASKEIRNGKTDITGEAWKHICGRSFMHGWYNVAWDDNYLYLRIVNKFPDENCDNVILSFSTRRGGGTQIWRIDRVGKCFDINFNMAGGREINYIEAKTVPGKRQCEMELKIPLDKISGYGNEITMALTIQGKIPARKRGKEEPYFESDTVILDFDYAHFR